MLKYLTNWSLCNGEECFGCGIRSFLRKNLEFYLLVSMKLHTHINLSLYLASWHIDIEQINKPHLQKYKKNKKRKRKETINFNLVPISLLVSLYGVNKTPI